MKKALRVLSLFGPALALAAILFGHVTPPALSTLPGRQAGIQAPTVTTGDGHLSVFQVAEAAHTPKLANTGADTECNALAALMNTGYIKIYSGTQPANADTAVSTQTLGSTLRFGSTAFGSSSGGVATANTITSDTDAAATITATWFRILKSDNSTVVMDGSICTSGCDINLATTAIVQHATVAISAFTLTQGKG